MKNASLYIDDDDLDVKIINPSTPPDETYISIVKWDKFAIAREYKYTHRISYTTHYKVFAQDNVSAITFRSVATT